MGAHEFNQTAFGKDIADAYRRACDEAYRYAGHQDGYNGTITTTGGQWVEINPRTKMQAAGMSEAVIAKLPGWIMRTEYVGPDHIWKSKAALARFKKDTRANGDVVFYDYAKVAYTMPKEVPARFREYVSKLVGLYAKWGPCCVIELKGSTALKTKNLSKSYGADVRRGDRVFVFFGLAAS